MSLVIRILPGRYAICRLPPDAVVPEMARHDLLSLTYTREETSIICNENVIPEGARAYRGYRCLMLQGPFPAESVGILASVLRPLADIGVFIMAFSTFDTDYILVPEVSLLAAVDKLSGSGFVIT